MMRGKRSEAGPQQCHFFLFVLDELLPFCRPRRGKAARDNFHLCNQETFLFCAFNLIINDMKNIYKKVFKSKKPSLGSIHGPGPATSMSISTGTTDLMPSVPACDSESDETQVATGVSVSVQLRL